MEDLLKKLTDLHLDITPQWNTERPLRKDSQWFIGKQLTLDGHEVMLAWFGDYKTGKKGEWKSELNGAGNSKELQKLVEAALETERLERERVWVDEARGVQLRWDDFSTLGSSPYLERKGIRELYGARVSPNECGDPIIVVPLRDVTGKLWNYQRIYSQKLSHGDKFFEEACRIEGCFHLLGSVGVETIDKETVESFYVCEGFATAASVAMAFGAGHSGFTVAAFNAGNLQAVCTELRGTFTKAKIVVCADNDAYTVINGREVNVGLDKGRRAAGAVGGSLVYPCFKYASKGLTDFNDLAQAEGLDRVKDQVLNPGKYVTGIQPMLLPVNKRGVPIEPTEKQISEYLHEYLKDKVIRYDKSLFLYCGTHWVEMDSMGVDKVKQWIGVAAQGLLGIRDITNVYNYFFAHSPCTPGGVNLFQPNPYVANFRNGSLHVRDKYLEFLPHDPKDYLTNTLPFDYPGEIPPTCPRFDDMVARLWSQNLDIAQIQDLIDELIGACLMPAFPVIAFFTGKPNSGKSTIIKLLVRLVSHENVCSVQLCDMNGFNMETMVGKLVNFDTDIDINRPMNDSEVKKIIDRVPRRIRRKGRTDIYGHLPAVHLFASNALPKTLDGSSHAYGRRLIIVQTESWTAPAKVDRDFEVNLLKEEWAGIVARGIRGYRRLLVNNGQFTVPESSHKKVMDLENENDVTEQFLDEVKHGEVYDKSTKLVLSEAAVIERKVLWELFDAWQEGSVVQNGLRLGKKQFFQRMEARGFAVTATRGVREFVGLGCVILPGGVA